MSDRKSEIICIECPRGCRLTVTDEKEIVGNFCPRGKVYGLAEITNPVRSVTSTVRLRSNEITRLPVRTSRPVPKGMLMDVMRVIRQTSANAPVHCGDVLVKNILGLDADLVATRDVLS